MAIPSSCHEALAALRRKREADAAVDRTTREAVEAYENPEATPAAREEALTSYITALNEAAEAASHYHGDNSDNFEYLKIICGGGFPKFKPLFDIKPLMRSLNLHHARSLFRSRVLP